MATQGMSPPLGIEIFFLEIENDRVGGYGGLEKDLRECTVYTSEHWKYDTY